MGTEGKRHLASGKTILMVACEQGRTVDVKVLLQKKPFLVTHRDSSGKTALHYCAESGNVSCAYQVVAADDRLVNAQDKDGYTAIHLAVITGNRHMVKFLLKKGANVNSIDKEKHSCVHWATVCGDVDILEILLCHGANASSPDVLGAYPTHYAAQMCGPHSLMGNDVRVGIATLRKLIHREAPVNCRDRDGREPLLWASSAGSSEAILLLFAAGANILSADKDGLTALHCAASRGHTSCIENLVTLCGARVDTLDTMGCSPVFYATAQGHADCAQTLLKYGADPNLQDNKGRTPAHCAAAKGQLETIRILDSNGADLWIRNSRGNLPIHKAVQSRRKDLVQWLLQQSPQAVNASNICGRTPLHITSEEDNVEMCEILLDYGAFINPLMVNTKGFLMTPLDVAVQQGNQRCAKYVQLHGGIPATTVLENNEINRNLLFSLGNYSFKRKNHEEDQNSTSNIANQPTKVNRTVTVPIQKATLPPPQEKPFLPESAFTNVSSEDADASVHIHLSRRDIWSLWESLMSSEMQLTEKEVSEYSGSVQAHQEKAAVDKNARKEKPTIVTNVYIQSGRIRNKDGSKYIMVESEKDYSLSENRDDILFSEYAKRIVENDSTVFPTRENAPGKKNVPETENQTIHVNRNIRGNNTEKKGPACVLESLNRWSGSSHASGMDSDQVIARKLAGNHEDQLSVGSDTEDGDLFTKCKSIKLRKKRSDGRPWCMDPNDSETSSELSFKLYKEWYAHPKRYHQRFSKPIRQSCTVPATKYETIRNAQVGGAHWPRYITNAEKQINIPDVAVKVYKNELLERPTILRNNGNKEENALNMTKERTSNSSHELDIERVPSVGVGATCGKSTEHLKQEKVHSLVSTVVDNHHNHYDHCHYIQENKNKRGNDVKKRVNHIMIERKKQVSEYIPEFEMEGLDNSEKKSRVLKKRYKNWSCGSYQHHKSDNELNVITKKSSWMKQNEVIRSKSEMRLIDSSSSIQIPLNFCPLIKNMIDKQSGVLQKITDEHNLPRAELVEGTAVSILLKRKDEIVANKIGDQSHNHQTSDSHKRLEYTSEFVKLKERDLEEMVQKENNVVRGFDQKNYSIEQNLISSESKKPIIIAEQNSDTTINLIHHEILGFNKKRQSILRIDKEKVNVGRETGNTNSKESDIKKVKSEMTGDIVRYNQPCKITGISTADMTIPFDIKNEINACSERIKDTAEYKPKQGFPPLSIGDNSTIENIGAYVHLNNEYGKQDDSPLLQVSDINDDETVRMVREKKLHDNESKSKQWEENISAIPQGEDRLSDSVRDSNEYPIENSLTVININDLPEKRQNSSCVRNKPTLEEKARINGSLGVKNIDNDSSTQKSDSMLDLHARYVDNDDDLSQSRKGDSDVTSYVMETSSYSSSRKDINGKKSPGKDFDEIHSLRRKEKDLSSLVKDNGGVSLNESNSNEQIRGIDLNSKKIPEFEKMVARRNDQIRNPEHVAGDIEIKRKEECVILQPGKSQTTEKTTFEETINLREKAMSGKEDSISLFEDHSKLLQKESQFISTGIVSGMETKTDDTKPLKCVKVYKTGENENKKKPNENFCQHHENFISFDYDTNFSESHQNEENMHEEDLQIVEHDEGKTNIKPHLKRDEYLPPEISSVTATRDWQNEKQRADDSTPPAASYPCPRNKPRVDNIPIYSSTDTTIPDTRTDDSSDIINKTTGQLSLDKICSFKGEDSTLKRLIYRSLGPLTPQTIETTTLVQCTEHNDIPNNIENIESSKTNSKSHITNISFINIGTVDQVQSKHISRETGNSAKCDACGTELKLEDVEDLNNEVQEEGLQTFIGTASKWDSEADEWLMVSGGNSWCNTNGNHNILVCSRTERLIHLKYKEEKSSSKENEARMQSIKNTSHTSPNKNGEHHEAFKEKTYSKFTNDVKIDLASGNSMENTELTNTGEGQIKNVENIENCTVNENLPARFSHLNKHKVSDSNISEEAFQASCWNIRSDLTSREENSIQEIPKAIDDINTCKKMESDIPVEPGGKITSHAFPAMNENDCTDSGKTENPLFKSKEINSKDFKGKQSQNIKRIVNYGTKVRTSVQHLPKNFKASINNHKKKTSNYGDEFTVFCNSLQPADNRSNFFSTLKSKENLHKSLRHNSNLEKPGFLWVHFGSSRNSIGKPLKRKPKLTSEVKLRRKTVAMVKPPSRPAVIRQDLHGKGKQNAVSTKTVKIAGKGTGQVLKRNDKGIKGSEAGRNNATASRTKNETNDEKQSHLKIKTKSSLIDNKNLEGKEKKTADGSISVQREKDGNKERKSKAPGENKLPISDISSFERNEFRLIIEKKSNPEFSIKIQVYDRKTARNEDNQEIKTGNNDNLNASHSESGYSSVKDISGYVSTVETVYNNGREINIDLGNSITKIDTMPKSPNFERTIKKPQCFTYISTNPQNAVVEPLNLRKSLGYSGITSTEYIQQPNYCVQFQSNTLRAEEGFKIIPETHRALPLSETSITVDIDKEEKNFPATVVEAQSKISKTAVRLLPRRTTLRAQGELEGNVSSHEDEQIKETNIRTILGTSQSEASKNQTENLQSKDLQPKFQSRIPPPRKLPQNISQSRGFPNRYNNYVQARSMPSLNETNVKKTIEKSLPKETEREFLNSESDVQTIIENSLSSKKDQIKLPVIIEPYDRTSYQHVGKERTSVSFQEKFTFPPKISSLIDTSTKVDVQTLNDENLKLPSNREYLKLPILQQAVRCKCTILPHEELSSRRVKSAVECMANVQFLTAEQMANFQNETFRGEKIKKPNLRERKKYPLHPLKYKALRTQSLKYLRSGMLIRDKQSSITFHIDHEKERNTFKLPTGNLTHNKKWQILFTISKSKVEKQNNERFTKQ